MELVDLRGTAELERALVVGLGPSFDTATRFFASSPDREVYVIGVNDIGVRGLVPDCLVCIDVPQSVKPQSRVPGMFESVARAPIALIHLPEKWAVTAATRGFSFSKASVIPLNTVHEENHGECFKHGRLPHNMNSPYTAIALAAYMGFPEIGLIGVDYTDTSCMPTGWHAPQMAKLYGRQAAHLSLRGNQVYNLSPISTVHTLPRRDFHEFVNGEGFPVPVADYQRELQHAPQD